MNKYESFLVNYISKKVNIEKEVIKTNVNIFSEGYIDSLGVFTLFLEIEEEFDIVLDEDAIFDDRLSSIEGLSKIIEERI